MDLLDLAALATIVLGGSGPWSFDQWWSRDAGIFRSGVGISDV
jgi:hypothetical protein